MRPRGTQRETHLPYFGSVPLSNSEPRYLPRELQVGSKANEVLYIQTHFSPNNKYLRPRMPISSPSPSQSSRGCIGNSQLLTIHQRFTPAVLGINEQAHSCNSHIHYSVDQLYFPTLEDLFAPQLLLHFTGVQTNKLPSSAPQRHFIHPGKKNKMMQSFILCCSESQETIPQGRQEEVRSRTINSPYPHAGLPPSGTRLHYSEFCCSSPAPRIVPLGWEGHEPLPPLSSSS